MTDECAAVIKMVHDLCIYVPFSLVSLLSWLGSFDGKAVSNGVPIGVPKLKIFFQ
jgi:hypothetical protein